MIIVVAAVIERDRHLLLTRRPHGTHLAGLWEFPGGKVSEGERHDEALRREIREELDAGIEVHDLLLTTTHTYPEKRVCLHFFRCTLLEQPRAVLDQEMRWVLPRDLDALEFPEADRELIAMLKAGAPLRS